MNKTIIIPAGWAGFYDPETKRLLGVSEFKSGGKAHTRLNIVFGPTKEAVTAALVEAGVAV